MKKLLLLDIDGTLLNTKKELPAATKEAVFKARENGHDVAIATGRAPFMMEEIRKELQVETFISFNGQYIVHQGNVIHKQAIDSQKLLDVTAYAEKKGHPLVYMGEQEMVSSIDFHPHIEEGVRSLQFPYPPFSPHFHIEKPVYQTLLFCMRDEEQAYHETFSSLDFVRWHRVACDILPAGGSKASGIRHLIEKTGHSLADTMAFGDGLNDLQMMELAGFSVAMGNGHEKTKEKADYVAGHVDKDGFSKAFKALGLI